MPLGLIDRLLSGQRLKTGSLGKICNFLGIDKIADREKLEQHFKSLAMGARKELLENGCLKNKRDHWILSKYYKSKKLVDPQLLLERAKQGIFKKKIDLLVNSRLYKHALTIPAKSQQIWLYDDPIQVRTSFEPITKTFTVLNAAYCKPLAFQCERAKRIGLCTFAWIRKWLEIIALPIALEKFD